MIFKKLKGTLFLFLSTDGLLVSILNCFLNKQKSSVSLIFTEMLTSDYIVYIAIPMSEWDLFYCF